MWRRLVDLFKNPSHEKIMEPQEENSKTVVSHDVENLRDVLEQTKGEGLIVGRTTDNNIALSVPGYALITMFMLSFRHGSSICGLVNSMGYHVERIIGRNEPKNTIEHSAMMIVKIFQEQKHGVMHAFPFVRADDSDSDTLESRYNAIMEPAQFIELVSSINELNQERPDFGSEALNGFVNEIVEWVNIGMKECITPVDMMSSMGAKMEGNA